MVVVWTRSRRVLAEVMPGDCALIECSDVKNLPLKIEHKIPFEL